MVNNLGLRARTAVYLGHYLFHTWSVAIILNIRTGHIYPQDHVVFGDTLYTVDHTMKGTFAGIWNTW